MFIFRPSDEARKASILVSASKQWQERSGSKQSGQFIKRPPTRLHRMDGLTGTERGSGGGRIHRRIELRLRIGQRGGVVVDGVDERHDVSIRGGRLTRVDEHCNRGIDRCGEAIGGSGVVRDGFGEFRSFHDDLIGDHHQNDGEQKNAECEQEHGSGFGLSGFEHGVGILVSQ